MSDASTEKIEALTDKLTQLTEVVTQMTQIRDNRSSSSSSATLVGLRLPNVVLPVYRSTDDLDDFLHQLRSILATTETPTKHWVALLKQQVMQDKRAFDLVRLAESQYHSELTSAKSEEDYRNYYKKVQSFLSSKRGKPKEEKTLDLLTKFNAMSQNVDETVEEFSVRFLDLHHDLQKLIPNIYVTTSQEENGSTKVNDLQLQLQFIVKLREEIRKEIVARQIKYDSIQLLLEAARRFETFHNPKTSAPCPSPITDNTIWCSALQCYRCGREGHFARDCKFADRGWSRWPAESRVSHAGWNQQPIDRTGISLKPASEPWCSTGAAESSQGPISQSTWPPRSFYDQASFDESQWVTNRDLFSNQTSKGRGKGRKGGKGKAKGYGYRQGTARRGQAPRKRYKVSLLESNRRQHDDQSSPNISVHRRDKEEKAEDAAHSMIDPREKDDFLAMPLYVNAGDIGQDVSRRQILATSISPRHDLPGVRTLIDTCCSISLVSREHAKYLQSLGYRCGKVASPIEVGMASEEATFTTSLVQEVPMCFDGEKDHSVRMECPVIDGLQWPLILGINHLTLLNARINCVDRIVQIGHNHWRTVLDCTESTSGSRSDLVMNTVDLVRCNFSTLLQPGLNEVNVCFSQQHVSLPDNPWVKDVGINGNGKYFVVDGPIDTSSVSFGSFNILVANTSPKPIPLRSYEPIGRIVNGGGERVSDSLRAELRKEKEKLDEAREEIFRDPDRDLPPTGDRTGPRRDEEYAAEVLKAIKLEECKDLSVERRADLKLLITKYCRAFHLPGEIFSEIEGYKHRIETGDHPPIYCTPYAFPESQVQFVKTELDRMVAEGICRPSNSPWSSPVLIVSKKDEHGEKVRPRLVVDYHRLNAITQFDSFPLPQINTLLSKLSGKCYFSKLDMYSGFWHIAMDEAHICKTSFTTPYGIFEYLRLPFGLQGAPASFMRMVVSVFADLLCESDSRGHIPLAAYMDDLLVSSVSWL
ncbi:retrovirus polyprotein, putative [Perkinsus marinus ATCC 50983]|uniref:Retrovirus polyprotein, putative n=2 Tax=Perkinsus marinus (strain ATCC 50983 / TXsc) TaxID=423536 RepID=C5K4U3_PERM5|nr:retrovirus polyprotein, putative [Perkinsus marinus ATCC 50983]EER20365.1 retrovirus polyprotein, putative [Perkinsus marinus ATCC 50983]|eukprot:XP_002788569.1 retrovirus polyprotein, putative [Perkinsus marinus ATCC 50983]